MDGIRLLQAGGIVSMTGDIVWRKISGSCRLPFLGGVCLHAGSAFCLCLGLGGPIYVFFAFRTGKDGYRFSLPILLTVQAADRTERKKAIWEAAQRYAELLEEAFRTHPLEWYHFDRFVHFQKQPVRIMRMFGKTCEKWKKDYFLFLLKQ